MLYTSVSVVNGPPLYRTYRGNRLEIEKDRQIIGTKRNTSWQTSEKGIRNATFALARNGLVARAAGYGDADYSLI